MIVAEEITNICKVNDNEPLKFEVGSSALKDVGYFLLQWFFLYISSSLFSFFNFVGFLRNFSHFLDTFFALLPI